MKNSGFSSPSVDKLAISYLDNNEPVHVFYINAYSQGAMLSCPVDMVKYIQFMINKTWFNANDSLLSAENFKSMQMPHSIIEADNGLMGVWFCVIYRNISG